MSNRIKKTMTAIHLADASVHLAVWLYSTAHSTTRAFWQVRAAANARQRLDALVETANGVLGEDFELQVQPWNVARRITAEAIFDNQLREFYAGEDREGAGLSDATVLDYWNYCNDALYDASHGKVPRGGCVTVDEFADLLAEIRPVVHLVS